jgi:3-phenylpropionate/trans-cinnamate dioxygenase ferredoxin subunit
MATEATTEQWVPAVTVADLPPGQATRITYNGVDIAIFNAEGEFYAIGDTCTHAEASLSEGDFYDLRVECPLHGSPFDITTSKALGGQATGYSGAYATKVEDGVVYVNPSPVTPRRLR